MGVALELVDLSQSAQALSLEVGLYPAIRGFRNVSRSRGVQGSRGKTQRYVFWSPGV